MMVRIDRSAVWPLLIRGSWWASLALAAVALLGLLAAAQDGAEPLFGTYTIVLSPELGQLPLFGRPGLGGATPTGIEAEIGVPIIVGAVDHLRFAIRIVAGLFVLYQLRSVFGRRSGEPVFPVEAPRRISLAGLIVIGAETTNIVLSLAQEYWVRSAFVLPGWRVSVENDRDIHLLLAGLVLLAVAEAYRAGVKLREEVDLTL